MASITATIKVRVGTTEQWTSAQKALAAGELGYDTEKHELRIGDGTTLWSKLPLVNDATITAVIDGKYISEVKEGTGDGQISVTKNGSTVQVNVHGLKSAAYTDTTDYATKAQGDKADTAVQKVIVGTQELEGTEITIDTETLLTDLGVDPDNYLTSTDIATGTNNGTIKVKGADVAVKGLGSAAYTEEGAYATAAQGELADSAIQSVTIAGQLLTGEEGVVSIDAAALCTALDVYTKAEVGTQITTALEDVVKNVEVAGVQATVEGNKATISESDLRNALTTGGESQEENLATQAFVNSSITASAARFITPSAKGDSQWTSFEALETGPNYYYEGQQLSSEQLTNNDYAIFKKSVEGGAEEQWRALYQKSGEGPGTWVEQYRIGSAFTEAQQAAIDSEITKAKVATYDGYDARITAVKATADAAMPKTGGAFAGPVTLNADPTEELGAATKQYVDNAKTEIEGKLEGYAPTENPTFTGTVTVPETPENDTDAASKKYVDNTFGSIDVSGDIEAAIAELSNTDKAVDGQYVSAVKESNGVVTVERKTLPTAPTITGTSPIKVDNAEGAITISHEGSAASGSVDEKATTFVSEVTTNETGHVTAYKTNTLEQALAALGTIEIDGGTAEDYLAGE